MFCNITTEDVVENVRDNGWYVLNLNYFRDHPEITSIASRNIGLCYTAKETVVQRYRRLNKTGRTLKQCPRKGVAVRKPTNEWYCSWLSKLIEFLNKHYGDVLQGQADHTLSAESLDHYVSGRHEIFQTPKMGMFAPYPRASLTKSVTEYVELAEESNQHHIPDEYTDAMIEAMIQMRDEDLAGIPFESIECVSATEAVYESNVQGLATGLFQLSRELTLDKKQASELNKVYDFNFHEGEVVADALIRLHDEKEIEFSIALNIVTNLKRVQVGGLDFGSTSIPDGVAWDMFKNAKYRAINANDPVMQLSEASAAIAFRNAIKDKTKGNFYNTLYDPDERWARIEESMRHANEMGVTCFPFDFEKHDARLHAEWMFNIMMHIVKPLFCKKDQPIIDLTAMCLVFKILLLPNANGTFTLKELVGALGSGDPWTNILGTLGTRVISRLLAIVRPDIFACDPRIGFNNGDDTSIGVKKTAIEKYGIDAIIKIANDIVQYAHYVFNDSKLINIECNDLNYVNHWEQFAIWINDKSNRVMRHGSTMRYFGKVYSDEDPGRQDALEGLIDQLSTINNTIGYVGDQTFHTNTMNLDVMAEFIDRDDKLTSYVNKYGQAFFEHLVDDAVKAAAARITDNMSDEEKVIKAESKILRHLRASGFDKSDLKRVIHDRDFSFLSVTKLVGLGSAALRRIADTGNGRNLCYRVDNGELKWLDLYAA